jgi:hypothetical protein
MGTKKREANLREEGPIRKMADFLRYVLPDYTAERQPKNAVQESDTPIEIPLAVTQKRESSDNDAETIDLRDLDKKNISRISSIVSEKLAIRL